MKGFGELFFGKPQGIHRLLTFGEVADDHAGARCPLSIRKNRRRNLDREGNAILVKQVQFSTDLPRPGTLIKQNVLLK